MTRKTTPHGRKLARMGVTQAEADYRRACQSPVAKSVSATRVAECLAMVDGFLLRISTRAYLAQDGERDIDMLANLAVMLGIGAEIGIVTAEDAPETRRMHAALRTVLQMSIDGGRWKAAQAKVLHEAASLSAQAFKGHPMLGMARYQGAAELGDKIRLGTARMSDVVGAEIYARQAVPAQPASIVSY